MLSHSNTELVFVYGILRPCNGNKDGKLIEENVSINGYMIDLGAFPAVITLNSTEMVVGDVLEISKEELARYDLIEGVPALYTREELFLEGIGNVWIYIYNQNITEWRDRHAK
jgi:gamma-glutamylcyclotransferase (GGCT)/AIG2-like uncharacterized protein YtfP